MEGKMADMIQIGDVVDIHFEQINSEFSVEIIYMPNATGDCFKLKREDGTLVNVQNYSKMVKINPL
jgi:hypothetical protein